MLEKIKMLPFMVYCAMTKAMTDLRDEEKGSSPVVDTVLLILVAVLAVAMVWGWMSGWLQQLWSQITGAADTIK